MRNMASVIHPCLAVFILMGSYLSYANADYNNFAPLISDVYKHYKTSSVFFIFSRHSQRMQEYTMVHLLSRTFSQKGVVTVILPSTSLNNRLNSYRKRVGRPLIVVLLKAIADIGEFNESTEEGNRSYPIWLVIFYGRFGNPICEYCRNPVGNMFGLRFDTLMLVVCCENPTVQEWWSVRKNETEINDFAIRTVNEQLKLLTIGGLNHRRRNVEGTALRVVIVPNTSLIHDYGHRIGGFLGEILKELKNAMNFTTTVTLREEGFGSYNSTTKSWSGVVGVLVRGEADLAIADLTMTHSRLDVIDFTYPLLVSESQLFIKEPDGSGVQWSAYFGAFTWEIWVIIIVLVITTPFVLAIIKVKESSTSLLHLSIDNYLCVWGIFCQQGLFEFPTETPLRIAYFSIFVSALVVSAAYSASLISFLTLSYPSLPFSTLAGFANDGSYKLIVYQNTSQYDFITSSNDPVFIKMTRLMKPEQDLPPNPIVAWSQVCKERVALYTSSLEKITIDDIPCKVVAIKTGRVENLAMALPAASQYTEVVNFHIERIKGNGIFNRLKAVYYTKETRGSTTHDKVEFSGVVPVLSILAGGIFFAVIVLAFEQIYYSLKNRGQGSPGSVKSRKTIIHRWRSALLDSRQR